MTTRRRAGFAMPAVIGALVIIGILVTAGFYMARQELRIGVASNHANMAVNIAQAGANEVMANWNGYQLGNIAPWDSTTITGTTQGGNWSVKAKVLGVPNLQFGLVTAALITAIQLAITPLLLAIPFIGPFLALAVNIILSLFTIAGVTGFLGPILTPFVSGLTVPLYEQPQMFEVLPASGPVDPRVDIRIDTVNAVVAHNGAEDELVLTADISP